MAPAVKLSRRVSHWLSGVTCSRVEEKVAICDLLAVEFRNEGSLRVSCTYVDVQRLGDAKVYMKRACGGKLNRMASRHCRS